MAKEKPKEETPNLEGSFIFGGTLDELNSITEETFKIVRTFYIDDGSFSEIKERLNTLGYDGLIHAHLVDRYGQLSCYTGVPVKKVEGE